MLHDFNFTYLCDINISLDFNLKTNKKMSHSGLLALLSILFTNISFGLEEAFFQQEECGFSCHVYAHTILSNDTRSVIDCAAVIYGQSCYNFLYKEDTGLCICIHTDRPSSKNLTTVNDTMVPSSDGVHPAQCYNTVRATCKNGGYTWIPEFQTCIGVYIKQVDFHNATKRCSEEGAHLVMPSTRDKTLALNRFLFSHGYLSEYWIGINGNAVEGSYIWSNGDRVLNSNWASGEPSAGHGENCVRLQYQDNQNYCWWDRVCHAIYGYICAEDK